MVACYEIGDTNSGDSTAVSSVKSLCQVMTQKEGWSH